MEKVAEGCPAPPGGAARTGWFRHPLAIVRYDLNGRTHTHAVSRVGTQRAIACILNGYGVNTAPFASFRRLNQTSF